MKNKDLHDEEIEQLLKAMPKIKDVQKKDVLYRKVMQSINHEEKKKRIFVTPKLVVACALILIAIISFSFLKNNEISINPYNQMKEEAFDDNSVKNELDKNSDQMENQILLTSVLEKMSVYKDDLLENERVFVYGIPDQQFQNVIPITIVSKVSQDQSWLDRYNQIMKLLQEEEWGLFDYYPYEGNVSKIDNSTLKFAVNKTHSYGNSSAQETTFFTSLMENFRGQGFKKIELYTENSPGIDFSNTGTIDQIEIRNINKNGYFLYYTDKGYQFLVPYRNTYNTIEEALTAMKSDIETHHLYSSIPKHVSFSQKDSGNLLTIQFTDPSLIEENSESMKMIEAILLTAKDFGYEQVQFTNTGLTTLGEFNLSQPIDVPIGPNRIKID